MKKKTPNAERRTSNRQNAESLHSTLGVGRWAFGVFFVDARSRSTRSEFLGALGAGAIVVAFCLVLLWHDPLLFWNDDYELSILPVFADVARSWSRRPSAVAESVLVGLRQSRR